jgi:arylsulfatase
LTSKPNFLLIVADDLSWSDLGAFGGEIDTPHLDRIASRGRRLTNFHASPVCSTTRAMLMTGCDHHEVGLGNMAELLTPD